MKALISHPLIFMSAALLALGFLIGNVMAQGRTDPTGTWQLASPLVEDKTIQIRLAAGRLTITGGCNTISMPISTDKGTWATVPFQARTTRRHCQPDAQEAAALGHIIGAETWGIDSDGLLTLEGLNGTAALAQITED